MTTESFHEFFTNIFYPWLHKQNIEFPVIFNMHNHNSYIKISVVELAREKTIEVIELIPSSTHIMQPLDISFFRPCKVAWQKAVIKSKARRNVIKLKKEFIGEVIEQALNIMQENEKQIIIKAAGLSLFDKSAVYFDMFKRRGKTKKRSKAVKVSFK